MTTPPSPNDHEGQEKSSRPSRWLSIKKPKGTGTRSKSRARKSGEDDKSTDSGDITKQEKQEKQDKDKSNALGGEAFRNLFKSGDKEKGKEKAMEETNPTVASNKISQVRKVLKIDAHDNEIEQALTSQYSQGEPTKAACLIDIWQKSAAGICIPYNKNVHMQGAVNVEWVTCYLDTLLFSMFAKLAVFECMLSFDFPKDKTGNKKKLARSICLWVNLLRSGFLIHDDVTKDVQNALARCGWEDAASPRQQDTSEAFNFICEYLEFPLQPVQVNLAHGGKHDEGDSKIEFERLLNIPVPSDPPPGGIKLEECLAAYFNASVINIEREPGAEKKGTGPSSSQSLQVQTPSVGDVAEGTNTSAEVVASPLSIHAPDLPMENGTIRDREDDGEDITPVRIPASNNINGAAGPDTNDQKVLNDSALEKIDSKMNYSESKARTPSGEKTSADTRSTAATAPTTNMEEATVDSREGKQQTVQEEPESNAQQPNGVHVNASSAVPSDPEIDRQTSSSEPADGPLVNPEASTSKRPTRDRTLSLIQDIATDEHGNQVVVSNSSRARLRRNGSQIKKGISIPAWQFYRLVPWHNVSGQPTTDFEVAAEFQKRPVVGVCLKRYAYDHQDGRMVRLDADIDIPEEMKVPFTAISEEPNGSTADPAALPRTYKFVLQSVICHRGNSPDSGHYISFARVEPRKLRENRRHDFDPPPDYEEARWVRQDDMDDAGRVCYIPDFPEAIKKEYPYLLFYQVIPMQDDEPSSPESAEFDRPPSYDEEFRISIDEPTTPGPTGKPNSAEHIEHAAPDTSHLQSPSRPTSRPSSIRSRPSTERAHSRKGSDDSRRHSRNRFASRPASMNLDSAMQSPVRTPRDSPSLAPADGETTASRLSRAAAKFKGKQSRNTSQQPTESRSAGADMINRMTGMLRAASREPLGEPSSLNLSNANSRTNTNARTSFDSTYRPSLDIHREESKESQEEPEKSEKSEKPEKGGGFLSRNGSLKKKKENGKKEKADKGKSKDSKGDKTPKGDSDQPDRECKVM